MLFWHKHDLDRAMLDLANFTPFPDEWSVEDKVLFEQAFQFHGKSFHRIRQMVSIVSQGSPDLLYEVLFYSHSNQKSEAFATSSGNWRAFPVKRSRIGFLK